MKSLLLIFMLILPFLSNAQKIGGFYSGTLRNDSARMTQKYELALDDYRGKITGYSYVTFISNDTFYYGIRKVKGTIVGDSLIIQDDKMIAHNFPENPAKGVGRTITIPISGQDTLRTVNGSWKTNQTKRYYSVPGAIEMTRSSDSTRSPLIAHLRELNLLPNTPNYSATQNDVVTKPVGEVRPSKEPPVRVSKEKKIEEKPRVANQKPEVVSPAVPVKPLLTYDKRTNRELAPVEFSSDSLILSVYDNGVVDGDTVSVYVNQLPVLNKVRLTTVANRQTVSLNGSDQAELILVAENLGRIPPNTGLLTIRDGQEVIQVNFSADLENNARIILRRKKKP